MDEYNLNGTRINIRVPFGLYSDKSNNSTLQKYQRNL